MRKELLDEIYEVLSCVNDTKNSYNFIEDWGELKDKDLTSHIEHTFEDLYEIVGACKNAIKTIEKIRVE